MISVHDFGEFFKAIHGDDAQPYPWQQRLLEQVVSEGQWPETISAPTGAGKSVVVEIHVFANALAAAGVGARVPRRLALVVNRRALTDAHTDRARRIATRLAESLEDDGVLGEAARVLVSLVPDDIEGRQPLTVGSMRGGVASDREWLNHPSACAVLGMTPAMWGSSALFRSYSAPWRARPRLAGLLAVDATMVLDEAHLNRQLLVTARRIADLVRPTAAKLGVPTFQAVAMSATVPSTRGSVFGLNPDGDEPTSDLTLRMTAHKDVIYREERAWPATGKTTEGYVKALVALVNEEVNRARSAPPGVSRTVGCIVNRVETAIKVTETLSSAQREEGRTVRLWVGRMRPWDLQRMRRDTPGLFSTEGDDSVDVLVATQTVEVGVDLDLAAIVTELASAAALAQRAGRLNRRGLRPEGRFVVAGPAPEMEISKDALPYTASDLSSGRKWVLAREQEPHGLSPQCVAAHPAPLPEASRILFQRPEPWNISLWSRTSTELFTEPELDLWLADDFQQEPGEMSVVLRALLPSPRTSDEAERDDTPHRYTPSSDVIGRDAVESLVTAVRPQDIEAYPTDVNRVRRLFPHLSEEDRAVAVLVRDGEVVPQWPGANLDEAVRSVRPGDVLVLDQGAPVLVQGIVTGAIGSPGRAVPANELAGIAEIIVDHQELVRIAADLELTEEGTPRDPDLQIPAGGTEVPAWLVRRTGLRPDDEEDERSTGSRRGPVSLEQHSEAVAVRCGALADRVGLAEPLPGAVVAAARWHDAGKRDERFQVGLRRQERDPVLAKSRHCSYEFSLRAWRGSGLPLGWRHELASAAAFWAVSQDLGEFTQDDRELVARLIGTSHGLGRSSFSHDVATAAPRYVGAEPVAVALRELLGEGEWESIIARTDRRLGPWGTAYLEALLRAADCSASAEEK